MLYPDDLHDDQSDLPICPERRVPKQSDKKLMTTLHNKKEFVIHHRNLQQDSKFGLNS